MKNTTAKRRASIKSLQIMLLLAVFWLPFVYLQLRFSHGLLVSKVNAGLQVKGQYLGHLMFRESERLELFCHAIHRTMKEGDNPQMAIPDLKSLEKQFRFNVAWIRARYWESADGLIWWSDFADPPEKLASEYGLASYPEMLDFFKAHETPAAGHAFYVFPKFPERSGPALQIATDISGAGLKDQLLVSIVDLGQLLAVCDFTDRKSSMPLRLLLKDESGKVIWGEPEIESLYPCRTVAELPRGSWTLMVVPENGWLQPLMADLLFYGLLGAVTLTGSGGTMWVVTYRYQTMNTAMTETRDALMQANDRLAEDVNLRRRTERALLESEQRFRNIYDKAAIGVVVVDTTQGYFLQVNPGAERIFGCSEQELQKLNLHDVLLQANGEPLTFVAEPKRGALELLVRRPDGNECWGRVTVNDLSTSASPSARQILVIDDITDRKRAEVRQKEMESQLIQAQKMQAVGTLAGGVAHDFNNMLQVIIGYCDILLSRSTTDTWVADKVVQVRRAARRSADLTRQLLTFAMQQKVAPQAVDLTDSIPRILRLMHSVIGADTELRWLPSRGLRQIEVDPSQLDQIMANLLMNARHAIERDGQITITAKNLDAGQRVFADVPPAEHDSVVLIVHDNGCGMTLEVQSRMFDPFFTTRDPGKGTGLGLSTVYGLVSQNNATIHVNSEPGQGTTIVLIFRVSEEQQTDPESDSSDLNATQQRTETILLAEDHSELLPILQSTLAREGYRVLAANSAREVLQISERTADPIHLLLTDVIMPGMNGSHLAEQLKRHRPEMAVLFMSGYSIDVVSGRALLPPDSMVIQKPFAPRELLQQIREVLDQQYDRPKTTRKNVS
jgi:PAS domain S-box-containing protein